MSSDDKTPAEELCGATRAALEEYFRDKEHEADFELRLLKLGFGKGWREYKEMLTKRLATPGAKALYEKIEAELP